MNKNAIIIVVDAFFYDYIGEKKNKKSATPFLDKLINNNNCVSINKMFSEAPYTEAALMSLLGGTNTMDNGAYMKRLKNSDCVLNEFRKNGYAVFANCFQSSIYPSGALTGANDWYYNSSFNFANCWDYRIKYFCNLYEKKGLTEKQFDLIKDILEDNFKESFQFLNCLKSNDKKTEMLYDKLDLSHVSNDLETVAKEYEKFKNDNIKYILNMFKEKDNHIINKLYTYPIEKKIDDEKILIEIENRYKGIVKKIFLKNLWYNFKNNHLNLKKIYLYIKTKEFKSLKSYIKYYFSALIDNDLLPRIKKDTYNKIKTIPSANTQFEHFKKWYNEHEQEKKNFLAYLHVDDIHFREMFFTHDTKDLSIMDEEFENIKSYIKKLPKSYKGSLAYDLGVRYIDSKIEKLFAYLESKNLLSNTDIIITADHGNSYTYQTIRESFVINFYRENYQIPCIIYSENNKFKINQDNFYQTKDIPATLLDMHKIAIPKSYKGKSLLKNEGRPYAMIQYAGSGCPDLLERPIQIGVRTKKYNVVGEAYLYDIDNFKLKEVYDLVNDPQENINLLKTKTDYIINDELKIINDELKNLQKENDYILEERK